MAQDPLVLNSKEFSLFPSDDPVTQLAVDFYHTIRRPPEVEESRYYELTPQAIHSGSLDIELEFPIKLIERQPKLQPRRALPQKVRDIHIFPPKLLTKEKDQKAS